MSRMNDTFAKVWKQLAELGQCDSHGGVQYNRVRKEFFESDALRHFIRVFIVNRANMPAQSFPHTDVRRLFENGGE